MKSIPRLRIQTYGGFGRKFSVKKHAKANEKARRSFYKYVCKEGLFTNLVNGSRPALSNPYQYDGFFLSGYPLYNASRSRIREYWELEGKERLDRIRIAEEEKERAWYLNLMLEEERRDTELFRMLDGSGVTAWDIYASLGWPLVEQKTISRDLLEAHAFLLAIKQHIKNNSNSKHEQHHRTTKRTLRTVSEPQKRGRDSAGGKRNEQVGWKSPALH